ncbi:MAG: NAD-dependent epimerase/dehydratase family protein [Acidimicrobiales bacterium]
MTNRLARRRVLVTGATGFIGSHLVPRLVAEGAQVFALTSAVGAVPDGQADTDAAVVTVEANVTDSSSLSHVVASVRPEFVVHQAAFTHVGKSFYRIEENIQTNIQGTVNLLQALDGGYERLVYVGSGDVYGDSPVPFKEDGPVRPASPYAVSKYAAERFCRMFNQAYGWPIVCLRPFNVYGPGQSPDRIIPELILAGLEGRALRMTGGRQTREFTYVDDVVEAFVRALVVPGIDGQVLNIGRGEEVSIHDLALTVLRLLGDPIAPLFGALPYRPTEVWRMFGDNRRAAALLSWEATTELSEGLRRTIAWYRRAAERAR